MGLAHVNIGNNHRKETNQVHDNIYSMRTSINVLIVGL